MIFFNEPLITILRYVILYMIEFLKYNKLFLDFSIPQASPYYDAGYVKHVFLVPSYIYFQRSDASPIVLYTQHKSDRNIMTLSDKEVKKR